MKVQNLEIEGLKLIELPKVSDNRGFSIERYHSIKNSDLGINFPFIQDFHSFSHPKVLRGLHLQYSPPQGKLVSVIRGRIWDILVDLRPDSPSFLKHLTHELSGDNGLQLWVPAGIAHGYCVLGEEPADILYKFDAPYNPEGELGINWNDPDLNLPWPIHDPILSERDKNLLSYKEFKEQFLNKL